VSFQAQAQLTSSTRCLFNEGTSNDSDRRDARRPAVGALMGWWRRWAGLDSRHPLRGALPKVAMASKSRGRLLSVSTKAA